MRDINEPNVMGTTDSNGQTVLTTTTDPVKRRLKFTFCVDNVVGTLTYESNNNVETCDSN